MWCWRLLLGKEVRAASSQHFSCIIYPPGPFGRLLCPNCQLPRCRPMKRSLGFTGYFADSIAEHQWVMQNAVENCTLMCLRISVGRRHLSSRSIERKAPEPAGGLSFDPCRFESDSESPLGIQKLNVGFSNWTSDSETTDVVLCRIKKLFRRFQKLLRGLAYSEPTPFPNMEWDFNLNILQLIFMRDQIYHPLREMHWLA